MTEYSLCIKLNSQTKTKHHNTMNRNPLIAQISRHIEGMKIGKYPNKWAEFDDLLPSGSGFDNGSHLDVHNSKRDKIIITTSFHHMDENGYYCGWTDHKIIVTPDFDGINIKVTGNNRNQIKEYIADTFYHCLTK